MGSIRSKKALLKRARCQECGGSYAKICLRNGYCSECSGKWRAPEHSMRPIEFQEKSREQKKRCAICDMEAYLVIDHNHQTNQVRGLICSQCNTGIGLLGDSPERLMKAVEYLTQADVSGFHRLLEKFDEFKQK
jgi:hypothetical protein